jgi:hypothetical protein
LVSAEPEETWTEGELKELKEEYLKYQAAKDTGTRASNAEAARDVTKTGDFIFDEVRAFSSVEMVEANTSLPAGEPWPANRG